MKAHKKQKKKKEHYVPQSYLSRFTVDGERLFVFDKFKQEARSANKKDVAHENYFYDVPPDLVPDEIKSEHFHEQIVEDVLAIIDGKLSKAIAEIITTPSNKRIRHELVAEMSWLLALQFLRTKETRTHYLELRKKIYEQIAYETGRVKFPELGDPAEYIKVELKKDHEALEHAKLIFDMEMLEKIGRIFFEYIWVIGINKTAISLYTSDNPIVKHHHLKHPFYGGWSSPGVEVTFPLTPKHVLILWESETVQENKQYDCGHIMLDEENVTFYNSLQVRHSIRNVFCSEDKFEFAKQMCIDNPDLTKPRERTVEVNIYEPVENPDPNRKKKLLHFRTYPDQR